MLFSFFAYGLTTSWLIVVGSVLALIFTAPPYNFSVSGVGLVSIASLIGAILGAFTIGPLADWVVKFMSRRNKGVYEPEFRLLLISVSLVLGGISFFGFGWSLQVQDPWIGEYLHLIPTEAFAYYTQQFLRPCLLLWPPVLRGWVCDCSSLWLSHRLPPRQSARSLCCDQPPQHLFVRDELLHWILDLVTGPETGLFHRWRSPCIHLLNGKCSLG